MGPAGVGAIVQLLARRRASASALVRALLRSMMAFERRRAWRSGSCPAGKPTSIKIRNSKPRPINTLARMVISCRPYKCKHSRRSSRLGLVPLGRCVCCRENWRQLEFFRMRLGLASGLGATLLPADPLRRLRLGRSWSLFQPFKLGARWARLDSR